MVGQASWRRWLLRRIWSHDLEFTSEGRAPWAERRAGTALQEGRENGSGIVSPQRCLNRGHTLEDAIPWSLQRWPGSRRLSDPLFLALIQSIGDDERVNPF